MTRPKRVLDIGAGTGYGLAAFVDQGWSVVGLEPDPSRARVARGLGLEIVDTALEKYCLQGRDFDLVTLIHTLEHFHDPMGSLKAIASQIRDGGYLYVEVPDILNYVTWRDSLHFAHLSNFSVCTLSQVLAGAGLDAQLWLQPKTAPHGVKHLGVFAQKSPPRARDGDRGSGWISLEQVRSAYLRGLTRVGVAWPIRYEVAAIEHYSSLRYWPVQIDRGVLRLERQTRFSSAVRKVAATPFRELVGKVMARVLKSRDPDFENIQAIERDDAGARRAGAGSAEAGA
jgi:SAM-dependent methyltransferase